MTQQCMACLLPPCRPPAGVPRPVTPAPWCALARAAEAAYRLTTATFFGGLVVTFLLDLAVHALMHWAAQRKAPVATCCDDEACEGQLRICRHCAVVDAKNARDNASDGKVSDELEQGCGPDAPTRQYTLRRQPCSAGNPDCCGPTARCYNTGVGQAAEEIVPGTQAAEVVAILQNDPHTKDLLRMGERRLPAPRPPRESHARPPAPHLRAYTWGAGVCDRTAPWRCATGPAAEAAPPAGTLGCCPVVVAPPRPPQLARNPAHVRALPCRRRLHRRCHRAAQHPRGPGHLCGLAARLQGACAPRRSSSSALPAPAARALTHGTAVAHNDFHAFWVRRGVRDH